MMDAALPHLRYMFKETEKTMDNPHKRPMVMKSLTQRVQGLFKDSDLTDVVFQVGESHVEFSAHRIILATVSPAFRSMLFGELYDSKEPISISDLSEVGFRNILMFTYDEPLHFASVEECLETLVAADKYLMEALTDLCISFLSQRISYDNVLPILDCAAFLDLPALVQPCYDVLDVHIDDLISSHALRFISRRLWALVLQRDKLPCREIGLFRELHQWAAQASLPGDVAAQRRLLGDLLGLVRLANMSVQQLVEVVWPSGLVPVDQLLAAVLASSQASEASVRRRGVDEIPAHLADKPQTDLVLFYHTSHVSRSCAVEQPLFGCLDFRVNAKLLLRGFQLFGPKKAVLLNAKGHLHAKMACSVAAHGGQEWAMRVMDEDAVLKPCSPLMNTYNYAFPAGEAALIYPNEWYRVTVSLESPAHRTTVSMCSEPVKRCTDLNVTFIFRKPGCWRKATVGDKVPYCKFLAGLHYQILSASSV